MANEPRRLSEAVYIFREAGFEVHLESLLPQPRYPTEKECKLYTDCRQCFDGFETQYRIIFTRPGAGTPDQQEDNLL